MVSVAGAVPFGVELYANFSVVFSLWARDAVPFRLTEDLPDFSITLRRGSTSGFLSSFLCICCPEFSPPDLLLPTPPPLSDLLHQYLFCAGISTHSGGGCNLFTPFYLSLHLPKLCQGYCFHVFHRRGVATVEEDLDSFMDPVHGARPKEMVS